VICLLPCWKQARPILPTRRKAASWELIKVFISYNPSVYIVTYVKRSDPCGVRTHDLGVNSSAHTTTELTGL
jgi:hypothetical protein